MDLKKESVFRFRVPRESIPIIEGYVKEHYPKSFESNLVRFLYVLDYVCRGNYKHRKSVPINMKYLSTVLGSNTSNTKKIVDSLTKLGLLNKDGAYIVGKKSTSYSLIYKDDIVSSIPFNVFSHNCTKRIINMKNSSTKDFNETLEFKNLANYLLSIDINKDLILYIIQHPLFFFSYLPPYDNQHREDSEDYMIHEFKVEFQNIYSIYLKDIFIKRPNNTGRVYTPFSVMDRDHRPYLSYEGKTLKCLDIANSQPLIFCAFLKAYCEQNGIELPKEEYEEYKSLVENGVFYEKFMQGDELLEENRKQFKQEFFGSVFYTKVSNIPYKLRKRFKEVFPKIYSIMDDIKSDIGNDGFALKMQELEADIVWDKVNAPMLREGYLCYNIYDSIVSHDLDTIEEAKNRMIKEFEKLNIKPKFKLEIFE